MNKKEKEELIDVFNKFAAEYEYHVIECADTRTMGREQLANDAVWQSLKAKMSKLETGKDVPEIRCPKCGSNRAMFTCVDGKWSISCEDCLHEKNGFKSEKAAQVAWRSKKK